MPRNLSRTGIVGFHAQRHTRVLQDGEPRTYYQFWGQLTVHGQTHRTKRRASMTRAFKDYLELLTRYNVPHPAESPRHPWEPPADSE